MSEPVCDSLQDVADEAAELSDQLGQLTEATERLLLKRCPSEAALYDLSPPAACLQLTDVLQQLEPLPTPARHQVSHPPAKRYSLASVWPTGCGTDYDAVLSTGWW